MEEILLNALTRNNIPYPDTIRANGFTRWGKKSRYWAVQLNQSDWAFGDFSTGLHAFAFENNQKVHSAQQYAKLNLCLRQKQAQEAQRIEQRQKCMAKVAQFNWESLAAAPISHPYLIRKCVSPHGIKWAESDNALKVPLYDINGVMWNIQSIYSNGEKRFLSGARKKGCFHPIGNPASASKIIICEGWATAASIYEATGLCVVAAMDAGNIDPVAAAMIKTYAYNTVIIAGDNDHYKPVNTGKNTAISVARKYGLLAIIPPISTPGLSDFNDIRCAFGLNKVREIIEQGISK